MTDGQTDRLTDEARFRDALPLQIESYDIYLILERRQFIQLHSFKGSIILISVSYHKSVFSKNKSLPKATQAMHMAWCFKMLFSSLSFSHFLVKHK